MTARTTLEMVEEFHRSFEQPVLYVPCVDDDRVNQLRLRLLEEEVTELAVALHQRDVVEVLDALTDIQYVLDGAFWSLGLAHLKQIAFEEVHRSNMSKLGPDGKPVKRPDGKVTKGPSYSPPNLMQFIDFTSEPT